MAKPLDPTDLVTLEDLAISTLRVIAALVDFLDQKRILLAKEVMYIRYTRQ